MKEFTIVPKMYDRQFLKENNNMVFKNRELIVEKETSGENVTLRFKIGDGHTPYQFLNYISSLYALYPEFCMCDTEYKSCAVISFEDKKDV